MKKRYWTVVLFFLVFGVFFTKGLWKQVNRKTFPKELIEEIDSKELKGKLTVLEKSVLEQFENIKEREYNSRYDEVVEIARPLLNSENGVELGSYMLGKLLLSDQLSPKNSLFVLNKLRVLKMRRQNFLESIRYCLEYIKLAKYVDSDYDVDRGKMGLSIIISSLNGYEISNEILESILKEERNYKDSNQVKIVALLNLAENNIRISNYNRSLEALDKIVAKSSEEKEAYTDSLMVVVHSLYSYNYAYLGNEKKSYDHLIKAQKFLSKRKISYFIDEHIYYSVAESLYNLYFAILEFSEEKTLNILNSVENKSDFGFLYYSYEILFEYYRKTDNFEKYEHLKRKYDRKITEINEINYKMLSLYMIESMESGISNREYKILVNRVIRMSLYIISLLLVIIFSFKKAVGLQEVSTTDFLTKINNRKSFDSTMVKISNKDYYMLIFDIDNFKKINDTYGHGFGDSVLRKIGQLLLMKEELYKVKVYRIGGEEFAVLFLEEYCSQEKCVAISEDIRKTIESLVWIRDIKVTVSGGLSRKCNKVYEESDKLLYEAKKSGKNKIINNFV
ncbi:GGDEF domain-containing protein [Cetobacterium sp. ZOR0034]|uniref:GGDEF domain-containing protein n=1 Tax=Cetobacterium sp. ZOR0034 TaxID=1339239 RepID=UPI00064600B6|nr:GGDEF domain-containing protein [Cetobacterium sp. ZOR0034]